MRLHDGLLSSNGTAPPKRPHGFEPAVKVMQGWSDRTVAIPGVETKLSHGRLSTIPPWTVEDLGRDRGGEAWPRAERAVGTVRERVQEDLPSWA
jgi:hypothetical protein